MLSDSSSWSIHHYCFMSSFWFKYFIHNKFHTCLEPRTTTWLVDKFLDVKREWVKMVTKWLIFDFCCHVFFNKCGFLIFLLTNLWELTSLSHKLKPDHLHQTLFELKTYQTKQFAKLVLSSSFWTIRKELVAILPVNLEKTLKLADFERFMIMYVWQKLAPNCYI